MLRALCLIIAVFALPATAQESLRPQPLANALQAAANKDWQTARDLAIRAGAGAPELIEWQRLRAGEGSWNDVLAFLADHGDWPGLSLLRKRSEPAYDGAPVDATFRFFKGHAPQTGTGVLIYADALAASGNRDAANAAVIKAWKTISLSAQEHARFIETYGSTLAPHHVARVDMALWRGLSSDATAMIPLLEDGWQKLATARIALRAGKSDVNGLINAIPAALSNDPGLAYERFQWRIKKGLTEDAIALLQERSTSAAQLGDPQRWAGWRHYLAHAQMRAGDAVRAYDMAAHHHLKEGSDYAELEWLAGYIALRYLNDAALARDHFQRLRSAVNSPISLGRAGYWIGRASEALGDTGAAQIAYEQGAGYQTSFYGLLAAERGKLPFDISLRGDEPTPDWRDAAFTKTRIFNAGVLLINADYTSTAEQFLIHLAEGLDRTGLAQLGDMAMDLDQPHLAIMIGKHAAGRGLTLARPYYALHPMRKMALSVPMELSLSIARRESEFDPRVVSGAGAQGLMQLMPGTAKEVAIGLNLSHDAGRVLSDWPYNATLGSEYLAQLADRFDGNIVMIAAGYNAGPSRPPRWISEQGDFRNGAVDVIDWIEHIPFRETRNYVMRVSESLPVYRARLGRDPHPLPFSAELAGRTISRIN